MKLIRHYEASTKKGNVKSALMTSEVSLFQARPLHLLPAFDCRVQRIIARPGYLLTSHRPLLMEVALDKI
jgi:hypothetical protein